MSESDRDWRLDWGGYPEPHYDEYDDCPCPDHEAMRAARRQDNRYQRFLDMFGGVIPDGRKSEKPSEDDSSSGD